MDKLKRLQKQYTDGKITKAQYEAAVADLLDDEELTQDEHDEAIEFEPEDKGEKAIYTQSDVDGFVMKKARVLVKKALREAGVDIDDIKPQEMLAKFTELAAAGQGKNAATDEELKTLRKKAARADELESKFEGLTVENAVLKGAGKYNPVNPAQVVRALNADYRDMLEYDEETGILDPKSVQKALRRIAESEPNLFHAADTGGSDEEEDKGGEQQQGSNFRGKTPGGAGGGSDKQTKEAAKLATQQAKALELMGIKPQNQ